MRASIAATPALASRSCSASTSPLETGGVGAACSLVGTMSIVRICRRQRPQRRFALHCDVLPVIVHLEDCFGGIDDFSHDDCPDDEGVGEPEAGLLHGAHEHEE